MNIYMVSRDYELKKSLDNTGYFEQIFIAQELSSVVKDYDIVLISDKIIDNTQIAMNNFPELEGRKVYYMLSNYNSRQMLDNIASVCKSKKINVIPPKLSMQQIIERIITDLFPNSSKNRNIVAFFGADSKVGTTMTTTAIGEALSQNTNVKVMVIYLNGQRGTSYVKDDIPGIGIDNMRVKIINQILSKEELLDNCIKKDNLYILPGIDNILDIRQFHPEHVEYLLSLATQVANIILIDCGNAASLDFSGALSIAGLNAARYKYLVTTQQKLALDNFIRAEGQVLDYLDIKGEDFLLILNKYYKSVGLSTPDEIAKKYGGLVLAGYIPYLDFKGWEAEYSNSTLLNDNEFKNDVELISQLIATQLEVRYIEKTSKKGFFSMFGR